jgi:PAS domain-containing protein
MCARAVRYCLTSLRPAPARASRRETRVLMASSPPPAPPPPAPPPAPALESIPAAAAQLFLPLLTHSELHGFIVLDAAGRFVYVSDSMRKLLGFTAHELYGCARALAFPRCAFVSSYI